MRGLYADEGLYDDALTEGSSRMKYPSVPNFRTPAFRNSRPQADGLMTSSSQITLMRKRDPHWTVGGSHRILPSTSDAICLGPYRLDAPFQEM